LGKFKREVEMEITQWGIPIIVAILTFFGGRYYEKVRISNENRCKLLEPIENWVVNARRLISIIQDEVTNVSRGIASSDMYNLDDARATTKEIIENKEKVWGILNSNSLNTLSTKKIIKNLKSTIFQIDYKITIELMPVQDHIGQKLLSHEKFDNEIRETTRIVVDILSLIEGGHGYISVLKTKYL
jgi:hypothetical protein